MWLTYDKIIIRRLCSIQLQYKIPWDISFDAVVWEAIWVNIDLWIAIAFHPLKSSLIDFEPVYIPLVSSSHMRAVERFKFKLLMLITEYVTILYTTIYLDFHREFGTFKLHREISFELEMVTFCWNDYPSPLFVFFTAKFTVYILL